MAEVEDAWYDLIADNLNQQNNEIHEYINQKYDDRL